MRYSVVFRHIVEVTPPIRKELDEFRNRVEGMLSGTFETKSFQDIDANVLQAGVETMYAPRRGPRRERDRPEQRRICGDDKEYVFPYKRKSGTVKGHCRNLHAPRPRARKPKAYPREKQ